jgi:hypothetical protein
MIPLCGSTVGWPTIRPKYEERTDNADISHVPLIAPVAFGPGHSATVKRVGLWPREEDV